MISDKTALYEDSTGVDFVGVGEAIIDAVASREDIRKIIIDQYGGDKTPDASLVLTPGGSCANVAMGVARLGRTSAFIGVVGKDPFGDRILESLQACGVITDEVQQTQEAATRICFISPDEKGIPDFQQFTNPAADSQLQMTDSRERLIRSARVLHFDHLSVLQPPIYDTTLEAIHLAQAANRIVSYDLCIREALWPDPKALFRRVRSTIKDVDVLKATEREFHFLTTPPAGARIITRVEYARQFQGIPLAERVSPATLKILMDTNIRLKLLLVTCGREGCIWAHRRGQGMEPQYGHVAPIPLGHRKRVNSVGCGDAFVAMMLVRLLAYVRNPEDIYDLETDQLNKISFQANAAGALASTHAGPYMPSIDEVLDLLRDFRSDTQRSNPEE